MKVTMNLLNIQQQQQQPWCRCDTQTRSAQH